MDREKIPPIEWEDEHEKGAGFLENDPSIKTLKEFGEKHHED